MSRLLLANCTDEEEDNGDELCVSVADCTNELGVMMIKLLVTDADGGSKVELVCKVDPG